MPSGVSPCEVLHQAEESSFAGNDPLRLWNVLLGLLGENIAPGIAGNSEDSNGTMMATRLLSEARERATAQCKRRAGRGNTVGGTCECDTHRPGGPGRGFRPVVDQCEDIEGGHVRITMSIRVSGACKWKR